MKKLLIFLAASPLLMAFSCGEQERVRFIPTPVSCIKGDTPAEPPHISDRLSGHAERDIGIIAASALRLRAWGKELEAMLGACR